MSPTFKQFLQDKTVNTDKNKAYYQWYCVERKRAFYNQAILKQKIYKNILTRWSGMDYSPGIRFETSLANMEKSKITQKI